MPQLAVRALEQKAALRQMADESGIPHKAIADMLQVSYSTFQAYLDPSIDLHVPSYRLPAFLAICRKSKAVTQYWAALQGAVVVPLPEVGEADHCNLPDVLKEMSELLRKHAIATSDGKWTPTEAAEYEQLAGRLQACVAAQVLYVQRQAQTAPAVVLMRRTGGAA